MNVLVIGGHKHGEWITLPGGAQAWVDIVTATTHRIRKLGWGITRLGEQGTMELTDENYDLRLAVHPDLTAGGPVAEQQVVTSMLQMLAMNAYVRANGDARVTVTQIPDTPAALFGPNGQPL